jgi:P-type Ca2+ transporter type 2C
MQKGFPRLTDRFYVLLIASLVAFLMGDHVEGIAVIIAILIAVLSKFISEYKAQKSLESLQKMTITVAKGIRNGKIEEIPSSEIVVGDLLFIEEGDLIVIAGSVIPTALMQLYRLFKQKDVGMEV